MKIAFYYNHYETLGHTARSLALADAFASNGEVLVFQGGKPQDYYEKSLNIVNMPHPYCGKKWFKGRKAPVELDNMKQRISFMKKRLAEFKPDVFMVEFFPFGREIIKYEIVPVINWLRRTFPDIKIVSSIGYPILSYSYERVLNYSRLFDKLLVHCPKNLDYGILLKMMEEYKEENSGKYREVMSKLSSKMLFTGYIIPKYRHKNKDIKSMLNIKDRKMVLISRGGGTVYPKIIIKGILAGKYLPENYFIVAVAGPSSSKAEMKVFNSLAKKAGNVIVNQYIDNFMDYLKCCDVSVSMAGYNTSAQLLYFKKKSIVFPKTYNYKGGDIEQLYRAKILREKIGASVLEYESISPEKLAKEIIELIGKKEKTEEVDENWFSGIDNSVRYLHKLCSGN